MSDYQVIAKNYSESSENRIHSDEIAKKLGFTGALVPGVAVYGHLTHPLVAQFGESWLANSYSNLRLLKPTYDGDHLVLTLSTSEGNPATHEVQCFNNQRELLATVSSHLPAQDISIEPYLKLLDNPIKTLERPEIAWDNVIPEQAFAPWTFEVSPQANQTYTSEVSDPLDVYTTHAHPHLLCGIANTALVNEYQMPTWIHVGTETNHLQPVMVGDELSVRPAVIEKWKKKGHEFIRIFVGLWVGEELKTYMLHTAIFKVAGT